MPFLEPKFKILVRHMYMEREVMPTGMPVFVLIPAPVIVTTLEVALNILAMLCK